MSVTNLPTVITPEQRIAWQLLVGTAAIPRDPGERLEVAKMCWETRSKQVTDLEGLTQLFAHAITLGVISADIDPTKSTAIIPRPTSLPRNFQLVDASRVKQVKPADADGRGDGK